MAPIQSATAARSPATIVRIAVVLAAGVLALGSLAATSAAASESELASIDSPAGAGGGSLAPARRLRLPGCQRVVILGDSLTVGAAPYHRLQLGNASMVGIVDGRNGRRISATAGEAFSGVLAAQRIRRDWGDADCWVIALGTNDHYVGGSRSVAVATGLVEQQLGAITPGARVWWVNVRDTSSTGALVGSRTFNQALVERAAIDSRFEVVDWFTAFLANPGWSGDGIHVGTAGSIERAALVARALAGAP